MPTTIDEALRAKLGREPTYQDLADEILRLIDDILAHMAAKGQLPHQRRRAQFRVIAGGRSA